MPTGTKIISQRGLILLAGLAIVLGGIAAYAGSFSGAMLYDDLGSIVQNPAVHRLWPWAGLPAGAGLTVSGRPVLQFSLALNYALGGDAVWGYHATNLAIHLLGGLILFGIARRTLDRIALGGGEATSCAFAIALLWTVHPLQTESVSYIVQRAESLMGLFYLLTLYCFIRAVKEDKSGQPSFAKASAGEKAARQASFGWFGLSWLACLFGMATKEVMVTAPLMALFYDRTFVAGTFREAWRRRRPYYAGLAATWLPLAVLVASTGGNRGGTAGFGVKVSGWAYGLTQFKAVAHYLRLSLWPHPLVFEYGTFWVRGAGDVVPYALPVLVLLAATLWALSRPLGAESGNWRPTGFLGAWFFGILAPSSLTPGTLQMIVEHRMYLPLAAVIAGLVLGASALAGKLGLAARPRLILLLAAAALLCCLTFRRNETYRDAVALWADTAAKRPDNAVAVYNLGVALDQAQRFPEACEQFSRAAQLRPDLADPRYDWGFALFQMGRMADAETQYRAALRIDPRSAVTHNGLGIVLAALRRQPEAVLEYQEALRIDPHYARARDNWGNALLQLGRLPEAAVQYGEAVRLDPDSFVAHYNLANVLFRLGRPDEAAAQYEDVLRLRPGDPGVLAALDRARQASVPAHSP